VTQLGEGRGGAYGAEYASPGHYPSSAPPEGGETPVPGELLAGRYQLEQHVNTDGAGRQIWRGIDVLLRRPVAVLLRYPGGPAAAEMLQTAVEASRIVHPNLVGVYDAIDEDIRAYVVREWVDGSSLRDHVAVGLFDTERAVAVAHAVAAAVTAAHSTGMTHGNIHPGTVLIGLDGRVVVADARADGAAPPEEDVRAIGGLLYFALTGYWPHAEVAGPVPLPDAMRDPGGGLAAPRQVRAGVPDFLDNLTMDLLDRRLAVPPAELLAAEFARLDSDPGSSYYQDGGDPGEGYYAGGEPEPVSGSGPLRLSADPRAAAPKPSGRKIAVGLAGLLVIGLIGLLIGLNWLTGSSSDPDGGPGAGPGPTDPSPTGASEGPEPGPIALAADQIRIVDPPPGDRTELDGVEALVDDDQSTVWETDQYNQAPFGHIKEGMGILIDLGEPTHVASVRVELATAGATAELRFGESDPGSTPEGDQQVVEAYRTVGEAQTGGTTMVFTPDEQAQYLMVWFTELSPEENGFRVQVQQVAIEGY
jgi:hypothetical protein